MSDNKQRGSDGTWTPETPADAIIGEMEPCEPYAASDIADALGLAQRTAKYRLDKLAEAGRVQKKKHGHTTVTFWHEGESDG